MSEQDLNSGRLLSGEEPSDEMFNAIMNDARDAAEKKAEEAQKIDADYERQYEQALQIWGKRLDSMCNGNY